ncbi:betaine-aldehyde dehydrogenase [Neptunomonas phycophila]|uniref:betaine-aldehyde dehydrogenase n=1 Tax=Neptunomonas phycophila TaxID=1572645 RepID=UPI0009491311|nr:betaine-aldehyde dehydrogenase [Neptunomonas phycophila]
MQQQTLFINGQSFAATSGEVFDTTNPATGEVITQVQQASQADVDAAVAAAQAAQASWGAMSGAERGRILNRAAQLIRDHNDELARLEVLDTGKPWQEAEVVDIQTGADVIEYFAGLAASLQGEYQDLGNGSFFYTRPEPLGVCAGIGAWNYPVQIAMWKAGPCLAAGNTMVFKPSEETPLSVMRLAELFTQAGLPDGVLNVVQGDARVGQMLTAHPGIAKVSFTGECGTGRKVMGASSATLKEVTMELGGKSPLIVFDDADLKNAVAGAMIANFYTQGEVCTNGTRVFVHESIYDTFLEQLKARTEQLVMGDPMDPNTQVGSLISIQHLEKVMGYIDAAKVAGARLLCGGERATEGALAEGAFVKPTVFADCTDDMPQVKDEIFGPVMSVLKFSDESEVIRRANDTEFGLAAGLFTRDISRAHRVIAQLEAGICWINTWGGSPAEMPVGGYKQSGIGRENGVDTLKHYTQTKSVLVELGDIDSPYA